MTTEDWEIALLLAAAAMVYVLPTIVAAWRGHPGVFRIGFLNLFSGWTGVGWIYALVLSVGKFDPPPVVNMSGGPSRPRPEDRYVELVSRLLELPPAERVLTLRSGGGQSIQLVLDSEHPLTVRLEGPWTEGETATARVLMRNAAKSPPDLARLLDPQDPSQGVVFSSQNPFGVSELVHRLAVEALQADPARLSVERDYEDHDARPEIVAMLGREGSADLVHEASGVRVRVTLGKGADEGYALSVAPAELDARRGQRHRARNAIEAARWRLHDSDAGSASGPDVPLDDSADWWGFSIDAGDAKTAADAALRLLCEIAQLPLDVRVRVGSAPRA